MVAKEKQEMPVLFPRNAYGLLRDHGGGYRFDPR